MIRAIQSNDLILWPDGTWCLYEQIHEYSHMSDDYTVVPADTPEYEEFFS